MKKDNFDIRKYLVENKLTETSRRNQSRFHFGKVILNENVVFENQEDANVENEDRFGYFEQKYGEKSAQAIMDKFYREPKDEMYEAQYTDDDDDFVDDEDFLTANGNDAMLGIKGSTKAAAAARKGMKGTDLDVEVPEDVDNFADGRDDVDFQDPEEMDDTPAPKNDVPVEAVDTAKIFGKNAPYVEVLVDDLGKYLKGPKGNWRVAVSSNLLRRAIDSVRNYMEDYAYPKKGFLLAPNKMGNYDEIPVLGINTLSNTPRAVVWVHREPVESVK